MKTVGMIFDNPVALNAAFYVHAWSQSDGGTKQNAQVNTGSRTITFENLKYMYILIRDEKEVVKISGIEFDAIFSEVSDPHCKQFIMSRFRPRFDK